MNRMCLKRLCSMVFAPKNTINKRMLKKINFVQPNDYVINDIEIATKRVIVSGHSKGVHVLCGPKNSGKTTAIKKTLKELQDCNGSQNPIYIDVNQIDKIKQNNVEWFYDQLGDNYNFVDRIRDNNRIIIVIDHISKNIINGDYSRCFFEKLAQTSFEHGLKFFVIVVTDDELFGEEILKYNQGRKFYRILDFL